MIYIVVISKLFIASSLDDWTKETVPIAWFKSEKEAKEYIRNSGIPTENHERDFLRVVPLKHGSEAPNLHWKQDKYGVEINL